MATTPEAPDPSGLELPDRPPEPALASTGLELPDRDTAAPLPVPAEPIPPQPIPPEPEPAGALGDLFAAHLQRVEVAMLSRVLVTTLAGALPLSMVRVERESNLLKRLGHRPRPVIGVSISADDKTLTFKAPAVGLTQATVSHTVNGVTLSTTRITVSEWLDQLAAVLNVVSNGDAATRAALQRALLR